MSYLIEPHSEKRYAPARFSYPALIHGQEGSGASLATIVVAAELVRAGKPVAWMCQKATAIRELQSELGIKPPPLVKSKEVTSSVALPLAHSRLVTMHGTAEFLLRSLRALPDWSKRFVILKNVETTLSSALWKVLTDHSHVILSGDFTKATVAVQPEHWPTVIGFSPFPTAWNIPTRLEAQYVGALRRSGRSESIMVIDRRTDNPKN